VARTRRGRGGTFSGFGGGSRGRGRGAYNRNRVHERSVARDGIASSTQTLPSSRSPGVNDKELARPPSVLSVPPPKDVDVELHLGSDDDDDDAPEVQSAKQPSGIVTYGSSSEAELEKPHAVNDQPGPIIPSSSRCGLVDGAVSHLSAVPKAESANRPRRAPPPKPKKPPRNPFAARSSLLRNLLLPEIRVTVSNLSQAIHFLVENDFLENVELKPGEANEKRIEVVGEQLAEPVVETEYAETPYM